MNRNRNRLSSNQIDISDANGVIRLKVSRSDDTEIDLHIEGDTSTVNRGICYIINTILESIENTTEARIIKDEIELELREDDRRRMMSNAQEEM